MILVLCDTIVFKWTVLPYNLKETWHETKYKKAQNVIVLTSNPPIYFLLSFKNNSTVEEHPFKKLPDEKKKKNYETSVGLQNTNRRLEVTLGAYQGALVASGNYPFSAAKITGARAPGRKMILLTRNPPSNSMQIWKYSGGVEKKYVPKDDTHWIGCWKLER